MFIYNLHWSIYRRGSIEQKRRHNSFLEFLLAVILYYRYFLTFFLVPAGSMQPDVIEIFLDAANTSPYTQGKRAVK
jgi:hypothetical protein